MITDKTATRRAASEEFLLHRVSERFRLTAREREVLRQLLDAGPKTKDIALQLGISPNTVKAFLRLIMVKMGVSTRSGVVGKVLGTEPLLQRISASEDPPSLDQVSERYNLTGRERQVLEHLLETGPTTKEIAARMGISPNTVKAFLRLMMVKMGVTTRSGIVKQALDRSAPSETPAAH